MIGKASTSVMQWRRSDGRWYHILSLSFESREGSWWPAIIFKHLRGSELVIDADRRAVFMSSPLFILVGVFGPMLTGHTPF